MIQEIAKEMQSKQNSSIDHHDGEGMETTSHVTASTTDFNQLREDTQDGLSEEKAPMP